MESSSGADAGRRKTESKSPSSKKRSCRGGDKRCRKEERSAEVALMQNEEKQFAL
jgi:hypothetical protein